MTNASQTIRQATIGIALLVMISKGAGFIREMVIAYEFGTNASYDVYLVAVAIPIALFTLVAGISNLLIPAYSEAAVSPDKSTGFNSLWRKVNVLFLAIAIITAIVIAFARPLIQASAPGFDADQVDRAAAMCRVASLIVIAGFLEMFFRSCLNCEKKFYIPAAGPIATNIIIISSILLFSEQLSTRAILYGLVIGNILQAGIVYVAFRSCEMRSFFTSKLIQRGTARFYSTAVVILIIEGSSQLYSIIDRYFASSLDPGVISALGYTYILYQLPISIFAFALSTAIFPFLTDSSARDDKTETGRLLTNGIMVSLLLSVPITVIFFVFSKEIVILVFQRGAFGAQSAEMTSALLKYFILGMAGQSAIWLMARAYYASKHYTILIINIVVAIGIKIILAYGLLDSLGEISLAVSNSASYIVSALFLIVMAGLIIAPIDWKSVLGYVTKLAIATGAGYAAAWYLQSHVTAGINDFSGLIVKVPVMILGTAAIIVMVGYFVRIREIRDVADYLLRRFVRK